MPETYVGWGIKFNKTDDKDWLSCGLLFQSINWNGERANFLQINLIFTRIEIGKIVKEK
jgi:hypothetical protein